MKIDWWLLTLTSLSSNFLTLDFGPFNASHTTLTKIPNIVYLNTPFNLSCSAQAKPPASYRFYRGQESLGNISVGSTLEISVSERTNQVNYACIPFNQFGDGRAKMILVEVYCKFSFYFVCQFERSYLRDQYSSYGILLDLVKLFIYGKS